MKKEKVYSLMENTIEIFTVLNEMIEQGDIKGWDDSDVDFLDVRNMVCDIAFQFEKKYPFKVISNDLDFDYLRTINDFTRAKILKYGLLDIPENEDVYRIKIVEQYSRIVTVKAKSEEAAWTKVDDMIEYGDIDIPCDGGDYCYSRELYTQN